MQRNINSISLVALFILTSSYTCSIFAEENPPIILQSKLLKFIDGIPHAMDGYTILDLKIISSKIRSLIYGHLDPQTKKRVGTFDFQDKKASLHILARIEERIHATYKAALEKLEQKYLADTDRFDAAWKQRERGFIAQYDEKMHKLEEDMMKRKPNDDVAMNQAKREIMRKHEQLLSKELDALKKEHMSDWHLFQKEVEELDAKRDQQLKLLEPALVQAKQAFGDITFPFMEQARNSKELMVPLIEEWAAKAGHKDSMLLRWSEEEPGSELRVFEQDISTCIDLDNMCCNLLDFLTSLIASCPRAYEQYETLKNQLAQTLNTPSA